MHYHLRRSDREINSREEIANILSKGKYAVLALVDKDQPYIVTLSYGYDPQTNVLYFHCAKEGHKIECLRTNPYACATVIEDDGFDADSCEHSYKSLVIRGSITLVTGKEEADQAIKMMILQLEKKEPEKFMAKLKAGHKSYDNLQILRMDIAGITGKHRQKSGVVQW